MNLETRKWQERLPDKNLVSQLLRKIFLEDWLIKVVALVVTFSLWLGVTGLSTPTTTRMRGIPLDLRFASDTELTNTPIQEVDIVITGDRRRIDQINKNDLVLSVDLTGIPLGDRVVQLRPENVSIDLPTGVRLDEVQPGRIAVRLEMVEEKEVDISVDTAGVLASGYEVYSQSIEPGRVRVRGPSSFVRSVTSIPTEAVDLSGRDSDFTAEQVPLTIDNPRITVLEAAVDVAFRIGEQRTERIFLLPINDLSARRATVVLFGPRSMVLGLAAGDIEIALDRNDNGEEAPRVVLPQGMTDRIEVRSIVLGNQ
ncbi:MAG: hypothetical protein H0V76_11925 [Blastocatellia bacterium]|nr:hypothetical protein [Blastocatellia bacterium]